MSSDECGNLRYLGGIVFLFWDALLAGEKLNGLQWRVVHDLRCHSGALLPSGLMPSATGSLPNSFHRPRFPRSPLGITLMS